MNQATQKNKNQISRKVISTAPVLSFMTRWKCAVNQYIQALSQGTFELVNPERIEIRKKRSHFFVEWGYGLVGIAFILIYILHIDSPRRGGFILMLIGLGMFYGVITSQFKKYPTFDKKMGWFWLGQNDATSISQLQKTSKRIYLKKIVAVQMISASIFDNSPWFLKNYHLYELNIVFDNLERLNIQCHGNMIEMSLNGGYLARFLDVPFYE